MIAADPSMTYNQAMDTWMNVMTALAAIACGAVSLWRPLDELRCRGKNYICCKAQLTRVEKLGRCGMCSVYCYVNDQGQQQEYRDLRGAVLDGEGGTALYARPDVTLYVDRDTGSVVLRGERNGSTAFRLVFGLACLLFGLALLLYGLF